jgi:ketosteroid isomerase-like protein
MSAENVEIVRRAYEAFNGANPEAAMDLLDPDCEWSLPAHFPDAETWRGRDRVAEGLRARAESWDSLNIEVHELIDGGDKVVALVRIHGRAPLTGLELAGMGVDAHLWTLRNGRAVSVRMYGGTEEALAELER